MANSGETRVLVESGETYNGKVIPTKQAEIDRAIQITEGATVTGGVYGASVEVGGVVEGSLLASDAVEIGGGTIDGEVGTPGKITGTNGTVYGTVTGGRIRLQETVVFGNVVGSNVVLEDCLVIGIVAAEQKLALESTLCYTFKSHTETVLDNATVVLPQAIVEGEVHFDSPVTVTGLGQLETSGDHLPAMSQTDIVEVDESTYLSLTPRILNLEAVTDRLDELEDTLSTVTATVRGEERPEIESLLEVLGVDESCYPAAV